MGGEPARIPPLHLQPLSVDFIDNQLPKYHEAFRNTGAQYDPVLRRYVPIPPVSAMKPPRAISAAEEAALPPAKPLVPAKAPMAFWERIFKPSKIKFQVRPEPEKVSKFGCSIRSEAGWDGIYKQLQKAREIYDGTKQGFWGACKRGFRRITDQSDVVRQGVKLVPDIEYVSPLLAAVEVLLDAFEAASEVRQQLKSTMDEEDLGRRFSDIEIFLATFPDEDTIVEASVNLLAAILKAVEDAIEYFVQNQGSKAASALLRGKGYQKPLLESLADIQTRSDQLIDAGRNSHISKTREALEVILDRTGLIIVEQRETQEGVKLSIKILTSIEKKVDIVIHILNSLEPILNEYERGSRQKDITQSRKHHRKSARQKPKLIRKQNKLKSTSAVRLGEAAPAISPNLLPQQATQVPQTFPWSHQHLYPGAPLPLPFLGYQAAPSMLPPFPQEPTSPSETLMVSETPLFTGPPTHTQLETPMDFANLLHILKTPELEKSDLRRIMEAGHALSRLDRSRAEQLVHSRQFRYWMVKPESRELLVHGEFPPEGTHYISPLSLVCATLMRALRTRDKYVSLVFFCGSHVEDDENPGAAVMIKSLITQLLMQTRLDATQVGKEVDLDGVKNGMIGPLCDLFSWLVRRLPEDLTLICMIDGISYYETDDFEKDTLAVLSCLLRLARGDTPVPVKILATSPWTTDSVRQVFKKKDSSFVSIASLHPTGDRYSGLRLGRKSKGELRESDDSDDSESDDSDDSESEDSDDSSDSEDSSDDTEDSDGSEGSSGDE